MEFRDFAEGARIPVLGLGTWGVGGRQTADPYRDDEEVEALRLGIDLGVTHIDTAEYYAAGHCEEIVGRAIEPYDRGDLFITTKVWRNHLHYDDLVASMKASLERLALDYVDLYLIHWPNPDVPLQETMRALEHCADEGYTRYIGVSNFPVPLLAEAQTHLRDRRLIANQVEYSLKNQEPRTELLTYCQKHDIALIAYTPLAKGRLAREGYKLLDKLAEKYGKSRAQVALNWLIGQDNVLTIPKASNTLHIRDNVGALGWRLSEQDFNRLMDAFS